MTTPNLPRLTAALALALGLTGCASIIGQPNQLIPIASTPSGASILITDEAGVEVFKGETPTTVTLPKSTGKYWGGKNFSVRITKDGHQPQVIPVSSSANGWYIAGNLVFGGLIGWFIVDPMNGNMYTLSPESVSATLSTGTAHNNRASDGSIAIVLLENVPAALRGQMQPLN